MFPDLVKPVYERRAAEYKIFPCHTNRASQIGGDCERQLTYARTHWEHAAKPSVDTIMVLQEGEKHEQAVLQDLRRSGFQILEQQVSLEWREFQLTAHLDAVVLHEGQAVPVDVKSASPWIFDTIAKRGAGVYDWEEVKDAFQAKPWLRKYQAQISIYCLLKNVEGGILLFINKASGALAQVNCRLDYDYAESLLKRAERINAHVAAGTLPDRIPFNADVCPKCPFYSLCLPDHVGVDPLTFVDDKLVEEWLEARERYRDGYDAYREAHDYLSAWAKARPEQKIAIGRWLVQKTPYARGVRVDVTQIESAVVGGAEATHG